MKKADKDKAKKKPPVKWERITCDDFKVEVDGEEYFPHLDEWVDIIPIRQLSDLKNLMLLAQTQVIENAGLDDPRVMTQYDQVCVYLSDSIFKWNWTDSTGEELPQPYKKPKVIEMLGIDEIGYLIGKLIGGRTDETKNV